MRLSRDDVLKADDLVTEEVDVPEWGGSVLVRGLTGRQRDEFEMSMLDQRSGRMNLANTRAKIVARCVVDDDGQRVFGDNDVEILGAKSAAALDRVFEVASRLSKLGPGDVEELARDFGPTNGASSSSASRVTSGKPSRASSPK